MERIEQILSTISATALAVLAAAPALAGDVRGEIASVDGRSVSVRGTDGETRRFVFDPEVEVASPSEPVVTVLDLERGQSVTVTYAAARGGDRHPAALRIELDGDTRIDPKHRLRRTARELGGE